MPGPEKIYQDKLAQGVFEIQRCAGCAKHVFYPRVLCPYCGSDRLEWTLPSGRGIVYSTTVVRRKEAEGGDYNVALVDLDEGPRMMSRVVTVAPTTVRIGMTVQARVSDGVVEFTPR